MTVAMTSRIFLAADDEYSSDEQDELDLFWPLTMTTAMTNKMR
jgi:hypothetical protein